MGWPEVAARLEAGGNVTLHPKGNSMTPRIRSGQRVVVSPLTSTPKKGDVVLAHLGGRRWYLHLVTAVGSDGRVQISNNHGRVNGWARKVHGVVTQIG